MTAILDTFRPTLRRRRLTGAVLMAALWLKIAVVAVALAQPVQAAEPGATAAEQDLLAALRVVCTPGGAKVLPLGDDGGTIPAHAADMMDCARCCCTAAMAVPGLCGACLTVPVAFRAKISTPQFLIAAQHTDNPGKPRAPPVLVVS